ncbi:MAG: hypothetical protein GX846_02645, partial [Deltaproteobacteria bacterium]|nr:hypothetical protein [Deltaproteobacteria bacterium]
MIRAIRSMVVFLSCLLLIAALFSCSQQSDTTGEAGTEKAAPSDNTGAESDPFAYTPPSRECDRAMLIRATESYVAAQEAGDLNKIALATDVRFKEDMSEVARDKGLWNTPLPIA